MEKIRLRLFKYSLKLNLQGPNPEVLVTKNQEIAIKKERKKNTLIQK